MGARSKFVLCPRGDHPWSIRFFEAIMSRAIPIIDDPEHTGRNPEERALGYHYLMREDVEKMMPELPEYCECWAEENLRIFLEHQAYDGAGQDTASILLLRRQNVNGTGAGPDIPTDGPYLGVTLADDETGA